MWRCVSAGCLFTLSACDLLLLFTIFHKIFPVISIVAVILLVAIANCSHFTCHSVYVCRCFTSGIVLCIMNAHVVHVVVFIVDDVVIFCTATNQEAIVGFPERKKTPKSDTLP